MREARQPGEHMGGRGRDHLVDRPEKRWLYKADGEREVVSQVLFP